MLLHFVRPSRVIIVSFPSQMAQHHRLHSGAFSYLAHVLRAEMAFRKLRLGVTVL